MNILYLYYNIIYLLYKYLVCVFIENKYHHNLCQQIYSVELINLSINSTELFKKFQLFNTNTNTKLLTNTNTKLLTKIHNYNFDVKLDLFCKKCNRKISQTESVYCCYDNVFCTQNCRSWFLTIKNNNNI